MRKIRDVLRLEFNGLSQRNTGLSLNICRASVRKYLSLARSAGLSWPLPEGLSDADLEDQLFPRGTPVEAKVSPSPDWSEVHKELSKPNVTQALLWEEYRALNPKGFSYSHFCVLYRQWKGKLSTSMRQSHVAGEKMFVDYAGSTVKVFDPLNGDAFEAQIFVAALGASNYTFAEATRSQGLEDWTGSHRRAFESLSGFIPRPLGRKLFL